VVFCGPVDGESEVELALSSIIKIAFEVDVVQ